MIPKKENNTLCISIIVKPRRPRHVNNFRPHFRTIFLSSGELFFFVTSFDIIQLLPMVVCLFFLCFGGLFLFPGAHALAWF